MAVLPDWLKKYLTKDAFQIGVNPLSTIKDKYQSIGVHYSTNIY